MENPGQFSAEINTQIFSSWPTARSYELQRRQSGTFVFASFSFDGLQVPNLARSRRSAGSDRAGAPRCGALRTLRPHLLAPPEIRLRAVAVDREWLLNRSPRSDVAPHARSFVSRPGNSPLPTRTGSKEVLPDQKGKNPDAKGRTY